MPREIGPREKALRELREANYARRKRSGTDRKAIATAIPGVALGQVDPDKPKPVRKATKKRQKRKGGTKVAKKPASAPVTA
jgi:hypothetical protein